MKCSDPVRYALCLGIGLAFSSAQPIGVVSTVAFPALALNAKSRRAAFFAAAFYFAGTSWPIVSAGRNFFGAHAGVLDGIALWIGAALLLPLPWVLSWTSHRPQLLWRAPLGLLLSVLPPFGLIGWASPVNAAGYLFPATSWFGVLSVALAVGSIAVYPKSASLAIVVTAALTNFHYDGPSRVLAWAGVDTHFGSISNETGTTTEELDAIESIQRLASISPARVIVFPEAVVPDWNYATDAFWSRSLESLSINGKTIIVGSKITAPAGASEFSAAKFAATIAILNGTNRSFPRAIVAHPDAAIGFRNVLVVRGAHTGIFEQRVPIPIGMWKPFSTGGVPLRLNGAGVFPVAGERAAILICYEQLLTWPILTSMVEHPTVIVAVANDVWAAETTIPAAQLIAVRGWARLISIPYVSATNY
jgi:predicted amidohydrolase